MNNLRITPHLPLSQNEPQGRGAGDGGAREGDTRRREGGLRDYTKSVNGFGQFNGAIDQFFIHFTARCFVNQRFFFFHKFKLQNLFGNFNLTLSDYPLININLF